MNNYNKVMCFFKSKVAAVKRAILSKQTLLGLALRPYAAIAQAHLRERKQNAAVVFNGIAFQVGCVKFGELLVKWGAPAEIVLPVTILLPVTLVMWGLLKHFKPVSSVLKATPVGIGLTVIIWALNQLGASGFPLWPMSVAYAALCWWTSRNKKR